MTYRGHLSEHGLDFRTTVHTVIFIRQLSFKSLILSFSFLTRFGKVSGRKSGCELERWHRATRTSSI
jgi:hypothetical protein